LILRYDTYVVTDYDCDLLRCATGFCRALLVLVAPHATAFVISFCLPPPALLCGLLFVHTTTVTAHLPPLRFDSSALHLDYHHWIVPTLRTAVAHCVCARLALRLVALVLLVHARTLPTGALYTPLHVYTVTVVHRTLIAVTHCHAALRSRYVTFHYIPRYPLVYVHTFALRTVRCTVFCSRC